MASSWCSRIRILRPEAQLPDGRDIRAGRTCWRDIPDALLCIFGIEWIRPLPLCIMCVKSSLHRWCVVFHCFRGREIKGPCPHRSRSWSSSKQLYCVIYTRDVNRRNYYCCYWWCHYKLDDHSLIELLLCLICSTSCYWLECLSQKRTLFVVAERNNYVWTKLIYHYQKKATIIIIFRHISA